jgi:hypothetical protein
MVVLTAVFLGSLLIQSATWLSEGWPSLGNTASRDFSPLSIGPASSLAAVSTTIR